MTRYGGLGVCLAAGTVLLAACGSSGPGGNASSGGGGSATMGVLASLTGAYGEFGQQILMGSQVAEDAINQAGGILGKPVKLVDADTVGDPADAIPAAHKLIGVDHVVAINGPESGVIEAVGSIASQNHVPMMMNGGLTAIDSNTNPWIFRANPSDSQEGVAIADYAYTAGYKTAAVLFTANNPSEQTLKKVVVQYYEKLGGKVLVDETLAGSQASYSSEVAKAVAAHPQVIITQTDPVTASVLWKEMSQQENLSIPVVGSDASAGSDYIKAVGPATAEKALYSVEGATSGQNAAANTTFLKYYDKRFKGGAQANVNYTYDGMICFALAMDAAHSTNPVTWVPDVQKVCNPPGDQVTSYAAGLAALKQGKKINYEGASGAMDFNSNNNVFGPFDVVHMAPDGTTLKIVKVLSGTELKKLSG